LLDLVEEYGFILCQYGSLVVELGKLGLPSVVSKKKLSLFVIPHLMRNPEIMEWIPAPIGINFTGMII